MKKKLVAYFSASGVTKEDDVLFGENWNNQDIDVKTRSIIIAAIITHVAFYTGWPKGWAVFRWEKLSCTNLNKSGGNL